MIEETLFLTRRKDALRTLSGKVFTPADVARGNFIHVQRGYVLQIWERGFVKELYHFSPEALEWWNNHYGLPGECESSICPQPEYEAMLVPYSTLPS